MGGGVNPNGPDGKPLLRLRRNMTPEERQAAEKRHQEALKAWREKQRAKRP